MDNKKLVHKNVIIGFQSKTFVKFQFVALTGFFLGLKFIDYLLYDEQKYLIIREEMEDEYWAKHGEPTEIIPYSVPHYDPVKSDLLRNSWIQIVYDKDKRPDKEKYLDK